MTPTNNIKTENIYVDVENAQFEINHPVKKSSILFSERKVSYLDTTRIETGKFRRLFNRHQNTSGYLR